MESIIASGNDQRIPELDVSIYQNQASYVISRNQTTNTCATPVIFQQVLLRTEPSAKNAGKKHNHFSFFDKIKLIISCLCRSHFSPNFVLFYYGLGAMWGSWQGGWGVMLLWKCPILSIHLYLDTPL